MKKHHAALLSLVAATAVALGGLAATRTMTARTSDTGTKPDPAVTARARWLDGLERKTRAALARRPPALPPVPHFAPVSIPAVGPVSAPRTLAATTPPPAAEAPSSKEKQATPTPPAPAQTTAPAPPPQPVTSTAPAGETESDSYEHEDEHESDRSDHGYAESDQVHADDRQSAQSRAGSDEGDG